MPVTQNIEDKARAFGSVYAYQQEINSSYQNFQNYLASINASGVNFTNVIDAINASDLAAGMKTYLVKVVQDIKTAHDTKKTTMVNYLTQVKTNLQNTKTQYSGDLNATDNQDIDDEITNIDNKINAL